MPWAGGHALAAESAKSLCSKLKGETRSQAGSAWVTVWSPGGGTRGRSEEHLGGAERSLRSRRVSYRGLKRMSGPPWDFGNGYKQYGGFGIFRRNVSKFKRHNVVQETFRGKGQFISYLPGWGPSWSARAALTNHSWLGGLNNWHLSQFGRLGSLGSGCQHGWVLGEGPIAGLQCPHLVVVAGGRGSEHTLVSSSSLFCN